MRRRTVVIITSLALVALLVGWAWGNLVVWGDVWRGQEYLSRGVGLYLMQVQSENSHRVSRLSDLSNPDVGTLDTRWCGYRFLLKEGIRLADVSKDEVVAVLVPTRPFPRWVLYNVQAPALVLHADCSSRQVPISEVPLALR